MSKEQQYIESIQNFSKSVEIFAKAFKDHIESSKNADNAWAETKKQTEAILEQSKKLTEITKVTGETKTNTDEILKIVKGIKKEKKSGLWDRIGAKDKKKNVREGIKTITLMAGGILAIGAAFKLVGNVDWKSVLSLSVALPAVSYAFNKVGETTTDPKEALNIAGVMIAMSGGLVVSSHLLATTPNIGIGQLISMVGVSVALGISLYGLSKITNELDSKSVGNIYALIPVLPLLAGAINASGQVLQDVPTVTLAQVLSTIGIGIAVGGALIPLAFAAKVADMKKATDMMVLAGTMPVLSAALYASALILQHMPTDLPYGSIIGGSLAISLAVGAFATPIAILTKMKIGLKEVALGTVAMTVMSAGLMAMSHVLAMGNYEDYPSASWATGVGLSMLGFVPSVIATGLIASSGFGAIVLLAGIASMIAISGGLVEVSKIISRGKYSGGPSVEWAKGTGTALMAFIGPMMALQGGLFSMLFGSGMDEKIAMIEDLGTALQRTSIIVSRGNYSKGPSADWAEGIGMALSVFSNSLDMIEPNIIGTIFGQTLESRLGGMLTVAKYLPKFGAAVGKGDYSGGPKPEWAEAVGLALMSFSQSLDMIEPGIIGKIFGSSLEGQLEGMLKIATYLPKFGTAIGSDTSMFTGGPGKEWSEGVSIAIVAFTEGLAMVDTGWFSSNIDEQLEGMEKIAKYIPKFGEAVGNDTSMYEGGPKPEWSESIANVIGAFVMALDIIEDGWFGKDFDEKMEGFRKIASLIPYYGKALNDASYTNFPSDKWVNGVVSFIDGFTSIDGIDKDILWKNILRLSRSYNMLAKSLQNVGKSLNSVKSKDIPDLGGLYSGLVTLSLIDSKNLDNVLRSLNSNWNILSDFIQEIKGATLKSNFSNPNLFPSWATPNTTKEQEKNTQDATKSATSQSGNVNKTQSSVPSVQAPASSMGGQQININVDELKKELGNNTQLLQQMINILSEIADNTGGGFGFTSNISN